MAQPYLFLTRQTPRNKGHIFIPSESVNSIAFVSEAWVIGNFILCVTPEVDVLIEYKISLQWDGSIAIRSIWRCLRTLLKKKGMRRKDFCIRAEIWILTPSCNLKQITLFLQVAAFYPLGPVPDSGSQLHCKNVVVSAVLLFWCDFYLTGRGTLSHHKMKEKLQTSISHKCKCENPQH